MPPPLLALVGPTASGKTDAAVVVAEAIGAEILCVDSSTVYRGMDVQTAKPSPDQRRRVPHHGLDVADPSEPFSVVRFQQLASEVIAAIRARDRTPLLVGGSGLYYRAVVDGLSFPETDPPTRAALETEARVAGAEALHARLASFDPAAANRIERTNARRVVRALEVAAVTGSPFSRFARDWERYRPDRVRAAGVAVPRATLYRRIEARAVEAFPRLLDETRVLVERGAGPFLTSLQAIGYAEAMDVVAGRMGPEDALAAIVRRIKRLVRRQIAWFRRDPRVRWFPAGEGGAMEIVGDLIEYLAPAAVGVRSR